MFKPLNSRSLIKPLAVVSLLILSTSGLQAQTTELYDEGQAKKERKHNEDKSIVAGAVVGGLIAGPPGVIVTAIFSALISNQNSTGKENKQLQASLRQNQEELFALQAQQQQLEKLYQIAREEKQNQAFMAVNVQESTPTNSVSCCADTELALHFRSNSSNLESNYVEQLQKLARLAKVIPQPIIEISGYADRRGSNSENLVLSERRIKTVVNTLLRLGVSRGMIQSNAFGENKPLSTTESLEGNFFDRRVKVKIRSADNNFITLSQ